MAQSEQKDSFITYGQLANKEQESFIFFGGGRSLNVKLQDAKIYECIRLPNLIRNLKERCPDND